MPTKKKTKKSNIFANRKYKAVGLVLLGLVLGFVLAIVVQKIAPLKTNALTGTHTPVILVHGYNNRPGNCQGIDLANYWGKVTTELTKRVGIPSGDVVPVAYYKCDIHGVDISGYGPDATYGYAKTTGTIKSRAGYGNNTSITQLAHDLSWFIYNNYTKRSQPVNLVGHSMGGLISREALRRVQAGDPTFPPVLDVSKVLTMSTPHTGWGTQCTENKECQELSDGSQFLVDLQTNPAPQGVNGTKWWAMGTASKGSGSSTYLTSACDFIPANSAIAVNGTHLVYTKPCYKHNGYLTDASQKLDAVGSPELGGRRSLAMMNYIMQ